jgi:hypothetical protein
MFVWKKVVFIDIFILKKVDNDKMNEDNNIGKFVLMIVAPLYF